MATPESKVKAEVKKFLDSLGEDCWYYCPIPMGYGRNGVPDILGCYQGIFFALELKAPSELGNITPWQAKELLAICRAGGWQCITENVEGAKKLIEHVKADARILQNAVQRRQ